MPTRTLQGVVNGHSLTAKGLNRHPLEGPGRLGMATLQDSQQRSPRSSPRRRRPSLRLGPFRLPSSAQGAESNGEWLGINRKNLVYVYIYMTIYMLYMRCQELFSQVLRSAENLPRHAIGTSRFAIAADRGSPSAVPATQSVRGSRSAAVPVRKMLRLPRALQLKVLKVLRLPRNLQFQCTKCRSCHETCYWRCSKCCACHEICTSSGQSAAPATKSAHPDSHRAALPRRFAVAGEAFCAMIFCF